MIGTGPGRRRVGRLLARRGLEPEDAETGDSDPLAEESLTLAGIVNASVQGHVALGPRAGARVRWFGEAPDTEVVTSRGPRHAHLEGFDLHATVRVAAHDRAGLSASNRTMSGPILVPGGRWSLVISSTVLRETRRTPSSCPPLSQNWQNRAQSAAATPSLRRPTSTCGQR